jgi:hypothetical protein
MTSPPNHLAPPMQTTTDRSRNETQSQNNVPNRTAHPANSSLVIPPFQLPSPSQHRSSRRGSRGRRSGAGSSTLAADPHESPATACDSVRDTSDLTCSSSSSDLTTEDFMSAMGLGMQEMQELHGTCASYVALWERLRGTNCGMGEEERGQRV